MTCMMAVPFMLSRTCASTPSSSTVVLIRALEEVECPCDELEGPDALIAMKAG